MSFSSHILISSQQEIEPLTISELNEYVIAAQPQMTYSLLLKDLKAFAEAIDVVRDKGVAMAVAVAVAMAMASAEDIDATVHVQKFSEVKKAL
ncbi:hypothetical protein F2Q69_00011122 [Brassica cretica]|uniref:Uncharacterized protein n=1 Tax=Brassica cretica TaxID=69181 RepID=A0A8S9R3F0_BRACR|nr:hypothetical protein F2Q69_00011122 [Brassica cretica]